MTRALLLSLAALLMLPAGQSLAVETGDEEVIFDGSGWGHGVGMSQYGAYGMATLGASSTEIIQHYYTSSSVSAASAPGSIWVNLEKDFTALTLLVENTGSSAGTPVSITSPAGGVSAVPGATIAVASLDPEPGCSVTVTNPSADPVVISDASCGFDFVWYDWAIAGTTPTTKVTISGCTQADWNVSPTVYRPCQYARGMLHLRWDSDVAPATGDGLLDLSAEMLLDDYVLGVSEMPFAWPTEALKAQAIASRSYGLAKKLERGDPATNSCDAWCHVKDSISDQRYVGWGHSNTGSWVTAVQATAGQIVSHPDATGGVVSAFFSSSSGGNTENVNERFGGPYKEYLSSVDDSVAVDGTVYNPRASWQIIVPASTVAAAVGLDYLLGVEITATRSGSGSAALIEYSGMLDGAFTVVEKTGTWTRTQFGLYSEYITVAYEGPPPEADEMFFYSNSGEFRYYGVNPDGTLGTPVNEGSGYTTDWDAITAVDLDGDGQDEMFFYRDDGLFRYYNIKPDGTLGAPILAGDGYTKGWDSITAVDLDGDGQDEMFFYRDDGLFRFYNIKPNGTLPLPMLAGDGYTKGWDSITSVDLDGDGQDEMFFYRDDGLFRYYHVKSDGTLPLPLLAGSGYSSGWDAITSVDMDGDDQDEMFFYRDDGLFRYYNISASGTLGTPILAGSNYSSGWSSITAVQLDVLLD